MPRRRFPVVGVLVGLFILLFALLRPGYGQPSADAPAGQGPDWPTVVISRSGGGPVINGTLQFAAITLKTDTGSTTINMSHVKRITFQRDPDGQSSDTVQLADKTIIRGRVTAEEFVIQPEGKPTEILNKTDIREIKVTRKEQLSLLTVLLGLLTLTAMEIILGVDNVIFLAIVVGKLPKEQQPQARKIGLGAALGTRLLLLFSLSFLLGLTTPVFTLPSLGFLHDLEAREVSWRDIILLVGGAFLIAKSVYEMHEKLEHAKAEREGQPAPTGTGTASFARTIVTIAIIDIVFSLDSVITAVGMVEQLWVMVTAMVLAMVVMLYFARPIGEFVDRHPTVKVLALSFLILIGVMLVAEGLGQHIDKGYIYAAMAFAVVVEMINMRLRKPTASRSSLVSGSPDSSVP